MGLELPQGADDNVGHAPLGPAMNRWAPSLGLLALLSGCGDEGPESPLGPDASVLDGAGPPSMDDGTFTVVVLPDTQFYANNYPDFFEKQAEWIVAQKEALRIAFVLHEGDVVDFEERRQWDNAARSLHRLDMKVPYVLAAGNHDIMETTRAAPMMNEYFPVATFMAQPWFKGTFEPDQIQNSYQIFPVNGQMWLVVVLEFGPRDEVLAWAKQILAQYPTTPAIIVTHAYLYLHDQRYDWVKYPPGPMATQFWGPHDYMLPGSINDGEEMWQKVVSQASNVKFVLSGHVPYVGAVSRLRSVRPDGTHVHEILANYQSCFSESPRCVDAEGKRTMGGWGYLRIMRFDPARHRVSVQTYSPVRNDFLRDAANEFEVDLE
jgi:hypothetical protein